MKLDPTLSQYVLITTLSYVIVTLSTPVIIFVALERRLLDEPDDFRKLHAVCTPNLGGVAIFCAFAFSLALFDTDRQWSSWNYLFASSLILFATGLKDDLVGLVPLKKFAAQLAAALIVVYYAGVRITDLHGLLGLHELPYWASMMLSITGIIFLTNAYNLIDGIDGLAGGLGLLAFSFFGAYFASHFQVGMAYVAFTMVGALLGFLRFNISPARIFMGDTGSLLIGFLVAVLAIRFAESGALRSLAHNGFGTASNLLLVVSVIIIPVFDTLRVFFNRISHGQSPFKADRNHVHHLLLDLGLSHTQASMTLLSVNILFMSIAYAMTGQNPTWGILLMFLLAAVFLQGVKYLLKRKSDMAAKKVIRLFYQKDKQQKNIDQLPVPEDITANFKSAAGSLPVKSNLSEGKNNY